MGKSKKFLFLSVLAFVLLLAVTSVRAGVLNINNTVPTFMIWETGLPVRTKTDSTDFSGVILSRKDPNTVQFQARGKKADGTWGNYYTTTNVSTLHANCIVHFEYNFGVGTQVHLRYRNYNLSIESQMITGQWNYF